MGSVLISSEDYDRWLPKLPDGWSMTLYENGPEDWRCDVQQDSWHKLAAQIIGLGWSPHAAVDDAIEKILKRGAS